MSDTEIQQLRDRISQLEAVIAEMTSGAHRRVEAPAPDGATSEDAASDGSSRRHVLRAAAVAAGAAVVATVAASGDASALDPNDLTLGVTNQTISAFTEADYMDTATGAAFLFQAGNAIAPNNSAFMTRSAALVGATTRGSHWNGVLGYSEAGGGVGVHGAATGAGGIGVYAAGPTGVSATATTAAGTAVLGTSIDGYGLRGTSMSSSGVVGNSTSSNGVFGAGTTGVRGDGATEGVRGEGLVGGNGVTGNAAGAGAGVRGTSTTGNGVHGSGPTGVLGEATMGGDGVLGTSAAGSGVRGNGAYGVYGRGTSIGVAGDANATAGTGVLGYGLLGVSGAGERYALVADRAGVAAVMLRADADFAGTPRTAPPSRHDAHVVGELDIDGSGDLWLCVAAGTPGTWRKLAGPTSAGAFHALTPGRVYDSRVAVPGPAAPLAAGSERTVSVRDRRSTVDGSVTLADFVPAGATAIAANVTVVETVGAGFLTANPGGVHDINAATINWSASGQILNNGVILTLDVATRELNVIAGGGSSAATHFVIDVTGYYR